MIIRIKCVVVRIVKLYLWLVEAGEHEVGEPADGLVNLLHALLRLVRVARHPLLLLRRRVHRDNAVRLCGGEKVLL